MKRYGVRGDEIHRYLDEPCRVAGQAHRQYRHDTKTIKLVGEIFAPTYGRELAENIALDHLTADHEEEIRNRKNPVVLLKCPNCGGRIDKDQNGKRTCRYCGYEVTVAEYAAQEAIESVKLPSKYKCVLLYRENSDEKLPVALPPLETEGGVIDEIYAGFEDKPRLQALLQTVGYRPVTVTRLRQSFYGCKTDSQIKELILQSRKITPEKISQLVNKPDVEKRYKRNKFLEGAFLIIGTAIFFILLMWLDHSIGL